MCGIAGFVGAGSETDLRAMSDAILHRGPDGEGYYQAEEQRLFLAHRRLTIVDPEGGVQPMWDVTGTACVIFNGEIYNHRDLRKELEAAGRQFASDHSDTEVLLNAYLTWGMDCLHRLDGMWAFALYDKRKQELILCRDRYGEKPLYYGARGENFAFASELTALLEHPSIERRLCPVGLKKYFAYGYVPAPNSLIEGVCKLPAGCYIAYSLVARQFVLERYWTFAIQPTDHRPSREVNAELIQLLDQAVALRLEADVPVGVFLSGGIDSSLVTALACRHHEHIESFSIGFDEASYDESDYARQVAEKFQTRHHPSVVNSDELLKLVAGTDGLIDEPMGDASLLPTTLLCRETVKHVKVGLAGDGADELLCGYQPYYALPILRLINGVLPGALKGRMGSFIENLQPSSGYLSFEYLLKRAWRPLNQPESRWAPLWMSPLMIEEIQDVLDEPVDPEEVFAEAISAWNHNPDAHPLDKLTKFYVDIYLQNDILAKTDRASMRHSLEIRAPFLSKDIADLVQQLPIGKRMQWGITKSTLKFGAADILPTNILWRRKHGFGVPMQSWFEEGRVQTPHHLDDRWQMMHARAQTAHQDRSKPETAFLWNYHLLTSWAEAHLS